MATIIKGEWNKKADEVRAAQHGSFIFIAGNGSKWCGEEADDIEKLIETLGEHPLDPRLEKYGNFITNNPCVGIRNTEYRDTEGADEWIDGPRIFDVEGVAYFFGNFFDLSHGFSIYTNDSATIEKLTGAIRANQLREDYLAAKSDTAKCRAIFA